MTSLYSSLSFLLIVGLAGRLAQVDGGPLHNKASPYLSQHVFLTVNSVSGKDSNGTLTDRRLQVHWQNFKDFQDGDWVGLFNSNPTKATTKAVPLAQFPVRTATGYNVTDTRLEIIDRTHAKAEEDSCVGFWVGYYRKVNNAETLLTSNCLRVYPTWMNDLKNTIQAVPLRSLMIPGTHDAGAWQHYDGTVGSDNIIAKYTYTQEETIYNQLVLGIRYLDVRVAYYPNTEEIFWVCHGAVRIYPLIELLTDIKTFVVKYREVVFMDFHGFETGFENSNMEVHGKLFDFVNAEMGTLLAPKSLTSGVTLEQLWKANNFIIWTYNENQFNKQHEVLWPYLTHAWGDVNKLGDLETYLQGAMSTYGCTNYFWSSMAEITPRTEDIISKPTYGLRGFAQEVNIPLNEWFQRPEWYSKVNIISTDYFLGNNVIEITVIGNQNRISCPSS